MIGLHQWLICAAVRKPEAKHLYDDRPDFKEQAPRPQVGGGGSWTLRLEMVGWIVVD